MAYRLNILDPRKGGIAKKMLLTGQKNGFNPETGGIVRRKGNKFIEIAPIVKTIVLTAGDFVGAGDNFMEIYDKKKRITGIEDFGSSSGMGMPYRPIAYTVDWPPDSLPSNTKKAIVNNDAFTWNAFSYTKFQWKGDPDTFNWYVEFEEDLWPDDNGYVLGDALGFDDEFFYAFLSRAGNDYLYKGSIPVMAAQGDPPSSYHANVAISDVTADDLSLFHNTLYADGYSLFAAFNGKVAATPGKVGIKKYDAGTLALLGSKEYYPAGTQKLLTQISGSRKRGLVFLYVRDISDSVPMDVLTIDAATLDLMGVDTIVFPNANLASGEYSGADGFMIWENQFSWLNADVADPYVYFNALNTLVGAGNQSIFRSRKSGGIAEVFVPDVIEPQSDNAIFAKKVNWP